jgi:iron complex outermembrane receptor protein
MIYRKNFRKKRLLCLLAATTVLTPLGLAGSALAETAADAADTADAAGGAVLGEIIVTATRKSENVQKVPISIQALSTETLAERHVTGLSDLVTLLPSVSFRAGRPPTSGASSRRAAPTPLSATT